MGRAGSAGGRRDGAAISGMIFVCSDDLSCLGDLVSKRSLSCTVVLCTYNGERFLDAQLDSLLAQTRLPDQIVVGDDASSDATWDIVGRFAALAREKGVEIVLSRQARNVGFVRNFSDSLTAASGDVVFFCDQDDVWFVDKVAFAMARFESEQALLFMCSDARLIDARGEDMGIGLFEALQLTAGERGALRGGNAFDVLLRRSMATGATVAFRHGLIERALPVGKGWIHDEWFAMVAAAIGLLEVIERPLIGYRQHGGNQIGVRRRTVIDKWRELRKPRRAEFEAEVHRMDVLEQRLSELGCSEPYVQRVRARWEHFERRVAIGRYSPITRVKPIMREMRYGNYRRFGTGVRSMLRDLVRRD